MPHYTFTNHILIELCQNLNRYQFNDENNVTQVIQITQVFNYFKFVCF